MTWIDMLKMPRSVPILWARRCSRHLRWQWCRRVLR